MIESAQGIVSSDSQFKLGESIHRVSNAMPSHVDIDHFNQLLKPVSNTSLEINKSSGLAPLSEIVGNAEQKYQAQTDHLRASLSNVQNGHDIKSLLIAQYEGANAAVGLQLASKFGSKSAESFESLIRQQ